MKIRLQGVSQTLHMYMLFCHELRSSDTYITLNGIEIVRAKFYCDALKFLCYRHFLRTLIPNMHQSHAIANQEHNCRLRTDNWDLLGDIPQDTFRR